MTLFPRFTSPLVIRPKAKQLNYLVLAAVLYLALSIWNIVQALSAADILAACVALPMIFVTVWHVYRIRRYAERDVTAMLPSVIVIGGVQILIRLLRFVLTLPAQTLLSVLALLAECVFWAAVVYCVIRAVCGQYKLLVPLALLFFGFFYVFIKHDLRQFDDIAAQVCLLLMIWFPVDAVAFTSLYGSSDQNF